MNKLSALRFYRIRRKLSFAREVIVALRNDVEPVDRGLRDALDVTQGHVAQIQEAWERKNIWKRIVGGQ